MSRYWSRFLKGEGVQALYQFWTTPFDLATRCVIWFPGRRNGLALQNVQRWCIWKGITEGCSTTVCLFEKTKPSSILVTSSMVVRQIISPFVRTFIWIKTCYDLQKHLGDGETYREDDRMTRWRSEAYQRSKTNYIRVLIPGGVLQWCISSEVHLPPIWLSTFSSTFVDPFKSVQDDEMIFLIL